VVHDNLEYIFVNWPVSSSNANVQAAALLHSVGIACRNHAFSCPESFCIEAANKCRKFPPLHGHEKHFVFAC